MSPANVETAVLLVQHSATVVFVSDSALANAAHPHSPSTQCFYVVGRRISLDVLCWWHPQGSIGSVMHVPPLTSGAASTSTTYHSAVTKLSTLVAAPGVDSPSSAARLSMRSHLPVCPSHNSREAAKATRCCCCCCSRCWLVRVVVVLAVPCGRCSQARVRAPNKHQQATTSKTFTYVQ